MRGSGKASAGVRHRGALARGCVEAVLDGPEGGLGDRRPVGVPRQRTSKPPMGGLKGALLPGRLGVADPGAGAEANSGLAPGDEREPALEGEAAPRRGGQGRERVDEAAHDGLRAAVVVWEAHGAAGRPLHGRGPVRAPVLAAHDREVPLTCARTRRDPSPRQADGERPHDRERQGFRACWNDEAGGACDGWAGAGRAPRSVPCGSGRTGGSSRGTAIVGPRARRAAARRSARASRHHGADP